MPRRLAFAKTRPQTFADHRRCVVPALRHPFRLAGNFLGDARRRRLPFHQPLCLLPHQRRRGRGHRLHALPDVYCRNRTRQPARHFSVPQPIRHHPRHAHHLLRELQHRPARRRHLAPHHRLAADVRLRDDPRWTLPHRTLLRAGNAPLSRHARAGGKSAESAAQNRRRQCRTGDVGHPREPER